MYVYAEVGFTNVRVANVFVSYSLTTMTTLQSLKNAARIPLSALLIVLLFPMLVVEHVIGGLTMVASLFTLLQCEDRMKAFKFITSYQTAALLKEKFPNSIAVRS